MSPLITARNLFQSLPTGPPWRRIVSIDTSTVRILGKMKHFLTVLLTVSLLAAGFPLHACGCVCADTVSAKPQAIDACPHCVTTATEPARPSNGPCQCDDCSGHLEMLPVGQMAISPAEQVGRYLDVETECSFFGSAVCVRSDLRTACADLPPPGPACSLPILLRHLLL